MILKIVISGKVQGVGFRKSVFNFVNENKLALTGMVYNLPTEQVEILVQGRESDLEKLLSFCHKGPSKSQVLKVSHEEMTSFPEPGLFWGSS